MGRGTRGTDRFLYLRHFSNTFLWGCPLIFRKMFASTHLYTWVERYCVSKVSQCPKTQRNVPGQVRCILTPKLQPLFSVARDVNGESLVGSFSDSTVTKISIITTVRIKNLLLRLFSFNAGKVVLTAN